MSTASIVSEFVFSERDRQTGMSVLQSNLLWLYKLCSSSVVLFCLACIIGTAAVATAQTPGQTPGNAIPGESPYVVEGVNDTIVYAIGHSIKINGSAKNGAFALGGDVIVEGIVEDVMVIGGSYQHVDPVALRSPGVQTIMYAGYEQELRNMVRNPKDLLAPNWSARS